MLERLRRVGRPAIQALGDGRCARPRCRTWSAAGTSVARRRQRAQVHHVRRSGARPAREPVRHAARPRPNRITTDAADEARESRRWPRARCARSRRGAGTGRAAGGLDDAHQDGSRAPWRRRVLPRRASPVSLQISMFFAALAKPRIGSNASTQASKLVARLLERADPLGARHVAGLAPQRLAPPHVAVAELRALAAPRGVAALLRRRHRLGGQFDVGRHEPVDGDAADAEVRDRRRRDRGARRRGSDRWPADRSPASPADRPGRIEMRRMCASQVCRRACAVRSSGARRSAQRSACWACFQSVRSQRRLIAAVVLDDTIGQSDQMRLQPTVDAPGAGRGRTGRWTRRGRSCASATAERRRRRWCRRRRGTARRRPRRGLGRRRAYSAPSTRQRPEHAAHAAAAAARRAGAGSVCRAGSGRRHEQRRAVGGTGGVDRQRTGGRPTFRGLRRRRDRRGRDVAASLGRRPRPRLDRRRRDARRRRRVVLGQRQRTSALEEALRGRRESPTAVP